MSDRITAFVKEAEFGVCGRNWKLAEDQSNSPWRVVHSLSLHKRLPSLGRSLAVQGELVGPGIQMNRYGLKKPTVFVFNVYDIDASAYLDKASIEAVSEQLGMPTVPAVGSFSVLESIDEMLAPADGKCALNPKTEREGLVWVYGSGDDRISFETILNRFLAKGGD